MSGSERTIGAYRILGTLGQGGMGVVYHAEHVESGRPAALKTVTVPRQGLVQSIRREIHALAQLRHPGIVPILDEGVQDQVPWYAMELVQGTTLRRWTQNRPTLELHDMLSLVCRICSALAYLHGEGIVHRDLKPDNVMVTDISRAQVVPPAQSGAIPVENGGDWPVLVDFGLVSRSLGAISRESLEGLDSTGGTAVYIAPEQARGEPVDARADLYSLGCMLYELTTGRRPFEGSVPMQVLYQQLAVLPTPPSQLVSDIPPELETLILRLMAKEARDRPGHAGVVTAALIALGAAAPPPAGPRPQAYLYRPTLAGRQEPLAKLRESITHLQSGRGGVVLLGGESGVGKTRLCIEAARESNLQGIRVLTGECFSNATSAPLNALRPALRQMADLCRELGAAETDRIFGRRGRVLALYEPALQGLPGQHVFPDPAELPPDAAQLRLLMYLTDSLASLGRVRPVLLILDDLQWADELSLRWIHLLLGTDRLSKLPLLVLGTYRSDEVGSAATLLRQVIEEPRGIGIALERLTESDVGVMIGDILALENPPDAFVRALARQSEGNPFFVREYLRAAIGEHLLYRDEQGRWRLAELDVDAPLAGPRQYERLPLPGSIRELVGKHLEALSPSAHWLAQVAAVLGRELDEEHLVAVARMESGQSMEAVAELISRQILEEAHDGELRFVHDKLREVAYERIQPERRKEIHLEAARTLEAYPDTDPAVLAHHWENAGQADNARRHYLAAARKARARAAHGVAEDLYRAYLRLVSEPTSESVEARNELGHDALRHLGRIAEAGAEHRLALLEARRIRDPRAEGRSLWCLGMLRYESAPLDEGREFFEEAARLARSSGDRFGEARALRGLSVLFHGKGLPEQARAQLEQCLLIFREIGDRQHEGIVLANLGVLELEQGRLDAARELYLRALAIQRQTKARVEEANVLHNLAVLDAEQGRFDAARETFQEALVLGRQIGARRFEGHVLNGLAALATHAGRLEEAVLLSEQSIAIHREVLNPRSEAITLSNLAEIRLLQGRPEDARILFDQAIAINRRIGSRRGEGIALTAKANIERRSGRFEEAAQNLEAATTILEDLGEVVYLVSCLCQVGHVALARDDPKSAAESLERARSLAMPLALPPQSEIAQAIERLERAQGRHERGQPLSFGVCPEDAS